MAASGEAGKGPLFITAQAVERTLEWDALIGRLAQAYAGDHGPLSQPPRTVARGKGVWLRALSAVPAGSRYMGTKVFGFTPQRSVNYVITLFDQETGLVAGFVDGNYVTARRTAGTSAVAVNRLAPPGGVSLAVLGSGAEARAHVEAIARVRPIATARVFSPNAARRAALAGALATELGIKIVPVDSAQAAVDGASLVVAAARSFDEKPILFGSWLRPDALVVSIGSTLPEQREIDVSVVEVCDLIVCDAVTEVCEETGDMIAATAAGIAFAHKLAPLSALVAGQIDAAKMTTGRRMFKSIGAALQDIVAAGLAFDRARELGLAVQLPVAFYRKQV